MRSSERKLQISRGINITTIMINIILCDPKVLCLVSLTVLFCVYSRMLWNNSIHTGTQDILKYLIYYVSLQV